MNTRLAELARHRSLLVERAAAQRADVGRLCARWGRPLAFLDRGASLARLILSHPTLAIAAGLITAFTIGKDFSQWRKWIGGGVALIQLARSLRTFRSNF